MFVAAAVILVVASAPTMLEQPLPVRASAIAPEQRAPVVQLAQVGPATSVPAPAPVPAPTPQPDSTAPPVDADGGDRNGNDVVRIGSDYHLGPGDTVEGLVVVMGTATIEGHVTDDLVVVLGDARLSPTAVVDGGVVVVGGSLDVAGGAMAHEDVVVVGGALEAPPGFMPGGEQVVLGFKALGDNVRSLLPWLMRGLLWGRPIVPGLPWVWAVVALLFVVYLGVLLVFERPVRAAAESLAATPLRAFATGLVVLLLTGPIVMILVASVVGLLVMPLAVCALFIAGLVGRIAAAQWLGARVVPEGEDTGRMAFLRSFTVGCVLLVLAYMVPILGGVVWVTIGTTGLGAAVLAFASAYRRENPPAAPLSPRDVMPPRHPFVADGSGPGETDTGGAISDAGAPTSAHATAAAADALALFPRASFTDRLAAFVLDAILVAIVVGIVPALDGDDAFIPILLAYRFVMWVWKGVTVGGIICQLRVVRADGSPMGGGEALVRSLGSVFSVVVLGLGCLWMLRDADRQTWHDKMAGTFVVKVPRHWPL